MEAVHERIHSTRRLLVVLGEPCGDNKKAWMPCLCYTDTRRVRMRQHDGKTYRPWEPQRYQHEAHSPAAKLPEGDLVFFLLDTVPRLDLSRFYAPYEIEFIPIKPLAAKGSDGLGSYAGHSRVPSRDRGHRPSTAGSGL